MNQGPYAHQSSTFTGWSVFVGGAWQPVTTVEQLRVWARSGAVTPQTPAMHQAAPSPIPLGTLKVFGELFPRPTRWSWALIAGAVCFVVVMLVCRGSASTGIILAVLAAVVVAALLVGKLAGSSGPFGKVMAAIRRPGLIAFWCFVVGSSGLAGRAWHSSRVRTCQATFDSLGSTTIDTSFGYGSASKELDKASSTLESGEAACTSVGMTAEAESISAKRKALAAGAPELRQKAETEAAQQREANAVATFPNRSAEIKNKLAEASKQAAQQQWEASDSALDGAQAALDEFKATSIEKDAKWLALKKQLDAQRAQIKPQVEVIRTRGETPEFLAGCCFKCLRYIKKNAKDPDSVECVNSTPPQIEGASWTTTTTYRAKNGFGALVMESKKFFLQSNEVVEVR